MLSKFPIRSKFILKLSACSCLLAFLASCSLDWSSQPEAPKVIANTSASATTELKAAEPKSNNPTSNKNSPRPSLVGINSLGLAPIKVSSAAVSANVGESDLLEIQDELQSAFKLYTSADVVALKEVKGISKEALAGDTDSLITLAKAKKIDGLLFAELMAFSSRTGSAIGTNQGAEFGVVLQAIDVESGKVAWEGSYYEQDKEAPLVSVSGGELRRPQFRSVESLIKEAFAKLGKDFSEARLKTYLAK